MKNSPYNHSGLGLPAVEAQCLILKQTTCILSKPDETSYRGTSSLLRKREVRVQEQGGVAVRWDDDSYSGVYGHLWALERIDPRLPEKVRKVYGHRLVGDKCPMTLQPTIFQNIPSMLQELDEAEPRSTAHSLATGEDGHWPT